MIKWFAYVNDGVELSPKEGRRTRKEAIQDCRKDRKFVMSESEKGNDLGFEYYVEKVEDTPGEICVLKTVMINFKQST